MVGRILIAGLYVLLSVGVAVAQTPTPTPTASATPTPEPGGCFWRTALSAYDSSGNPLYTVGPERHIFVRKSADGSMTGYIEYRLVLTSTGQVDPGLSNWCRRPLSASDLYGMGQDTLNSISGWLDLKISELENLPTPTPSPTPTPTP